MNKFSDKVITEAFIPEHDFLNRKADAENIKQILNAYSDGLTMSINSQWGNGKTWFLKNFEKYIETDHTVIYYNIWENELLDDPFGSFFSHIYNHLKTNDNDVKNQDDKEKLLEFGKKIARYGLPVLARLFLSKYVDINQVGEILISSLESFDKFVDETITDNTEKKQNIENFKNSLEEYASKLATSGKPLVIMIDELDRCSPIYAIRFLETLKHFFQINNIIYILAIDKTSLCDFIKHHYGVHTNTSGYLRKIINIQYELRIPNTPNWKLLLEDKEYAYEDTKIFGSVDYNYGKEYLTWFIDLYKLSIRDIDRLLDSLYCMSKINAQINKKFEDFNIYMIFIIVLKFKKPDVFKQIFIEKDKQAVINELQFLKTNKDRFTSYELREKLFFELFAFPLYLVTSNKFEFISLEFYKLFSEPQKELEEIYQRRLIGLTDTYKFINNIFANIVIDL